MPVQTHLEIATSHITSSDYDLLKHCAENTNFPSEESRTKLAEMVAKLFDHWGLSKTDQLLLLGLSPQDRVTLSRDQSGNPHDDDIELLDRAGHLLSIHKLLRIIFPHNQDLVFLWITAPNTTFAGKTPLDIMRSGYEGLLAVRRYLDYEREL